MQAKISEYKLQMKKIQDIVLWAISDGNLNKHYLNT